MFRRYAQQPQHPAAPGQVRANSAHTAVWLTSSPVHQQKPALGSARPQKDITVISMTTVSFLLMVFLTSAVTGRAPATRSEAIGTAPLPATRRTDAVRPPDSALLSVSAAAASAAASEHEGARAQPLCTLVPIEARQPDMASVARSAMFAWGDSLTFVYAIDADVRAHAVRVAELYGLLQKNEDARAEADTLLFPLRMLRPYARAGSHEGGGSDDSVHRLRSPDEVVTVFPAALGPADGVDAAFAMWAHVAKTILKDSHSPSRPFAPCAWFMRATPRMFVNRAALWPSAYLRNVNPFIVPAIAGQRRNERFVSQSSPLHKRMDVMLAPLMVSRSLVNFAHRDEERINMTECQRYADTAPVDAHAHLAVPVDQRTDAMLSTCVRAWNSERWAEIRVMHTRQHMTAGVNEIERFMDAKLQCLCCFVTFGSVNGNLQSRIGADLRTNCWRRLTAEEQAAVEGGKEYAPQTQLSTWCGSENALDQCASLADGLLSGDKVPIDAARLPS
jgi:hypothetical protein